MGNRTRYSISNRIKSLKRNIDSIKDKDKDIIPLLPSFDHFTKIWKKQEKWQLLELVRLHGIDYDKITENFESKKRDQIVRQISKLRKEELGEEYQDVIPVLQENIIKQWNEEELDKLQQLILTYGKSYDKIAKKLDG